MSEMTPPPSTPNIRRTSVRWLLLLVHGGIFASIIFAYPTLFTTAPDSTLWLILSAWGIVVVIHLLLVCLLEIREGIRIYTQKSAYRNAQSAYQRQKIKERLES